MSLILILATAYLLLGLFLFLVQRRIIYHPSRKVETRPSEHGLPYTEEILASADGVRFPVWKIGVDEGRILVVFFHGNAGNISHRISTYQILYDLGVAVYAPEYRGYGQSSGRATEKGIISDLHTIAADVRAEAEARRTPVVAMGRSLGGAVAASFANLYGVSGLVLESSFTSVAELGRRILPIFPLSLILRERFDTIRALQAVDCPVIVIHSRDDDLIPFSMGRKLYDAAPEPKSFLEISGSHNEGFVVSKETYRIALAAFFASLK